jgi:hypothetical protein
MSGIPLDQFYGGTRPDLTEMLRATGPNIDEMLKSARPDLPTMGRGSQDEDINTDT